ncbi:hypothetical protein PIB30_013014 [Stylosanthes scabra]|uniref:Uncharacterized protein n=1 Tax=Stylosanthes scabra TaxID=79078 RepID=A0ABU6R6U9_9FABA|nr:hypothetical protein [Stylosanthes scabra]
MVTGNTKYDVGGNDNSVLALEKELSDTTCSSTDLDLAVPPPPQLNPIPNQAEPPPLPCRHPLSQLNCPLHPLPNPPPLCLRELPLLTFESSSSELLVNPSLTTHQVRPLIRLFHFHSSDSHSRPLYKIGIGVTPTTFAPN